MTKTISYETSIVKKLKKISRSKQCWCMLTDGQQVYYAREVNKIIPGRLNAAYSNMCVNLSRVVQGLEELSKKQRR